MAKVWAGVKKGASDASTATAIEAQYLKCKQSGFKHPPEVEEQINIMRANRDEIPKLKAKISTFVDCLKKQADAEANAAKEFAAQSGAPGQHPTLAKILTLYSDAQAAISADRHVYVAALEAVREEWKALEAQDLHQISKHQEAANKNLVTFTYYDRQKEHDKAEPFRVTYDQNVSDFVTQVHNLREKKEELEPGYILRCIQSEVLFLRSALQYAESCESSIRGLGPVSPIRYTGWQGLGKGSGIQDYQEPHRSSSSTQGLTAPNTGYSVPSEPHRAPPPLPAISGPRARGMYQFNGSNPQELSFAPGDILNIRNQDGPWWQAELNGNVGLIPSNYVQLI